MTARDRGLAAETRELLAAVLEAIDVPYAATTGGEETRARIMGERVMQLKVSLRPLAEASDRGDRYMDEVFTDGLAYLREQLAEMPAAGFVTHDQAQRRRAAGASWEDAVSLDYRPPAGADQDEEPLAGDQDDEDECGVPDRAPLIVAAPTEPPTTRTLQDDEDPDGGCVAEFIDGSWTYAECGCVECRTHLAEDPTSGEEL